MDILFWKYKSAEECGEEERKKIPWGKQLLRGEKKEVQISEAEMRTQKGNKYNKKSERKAMVKKNIKCYSFLKM